MFIKIRPNLTENEQEGGELWLQEQNQNNRNR